MWGDLFLSLLLVFSLAACGGAPGLQAQNNNNAAAQPLLTPLQIIMGGRLASALDDTGTPKPGSVRGHVNFIAPAAIAVRGPDLYVADVGALKLYRLDSMQQALSIVPKVVATPRMRLQVAADLSLYILDPDHAAILHYTRSGRLLQKFTDHALAINPTHFVLDEGMGRLFASDQLGQRLLRLPLAGRILSALPETETQQFRAIGALAISGEQMYVLDTGCVCVVRLDVEGRLQERFGYDALKLPHAMVADRGRVFVADGFDRRLKVFEHGRLVASYTTQQLGIVSIADLALANDVLYVSDRSGARVAAFRVQPLASYVNAPGG